MRTIKFGNYWQDNARRKEPVKWLVLSEKGNNALLISKYALDCKPFNQKRCNITWEECTLRKWLNSEFINNTFSEEEKRIIALTKNDTRNSKTTEDKVFLLSIEEADKYLTKKVRKCNPTIHAKYSALWHDEYNNCCWWLRYPGIYKRFTSYAHGDNLCGYSSFVNDYNYAVRPCLWVNNKVLNSAK